MKRWYGIVAGALAVAVCASIGLALSSQQVGTTALLLLMVAIIAMVVALWAAWKMGRQLRDLETRAAAEQSTQKTLNEEATLLTNYLALLTDLVPL